MRDAILLKKLVSEITDGKKIFEVRSDEVSEILSLQPLPMDRMTADKLNLHFQMIEDLGLAKLRKIASGGFEVERIFPGAYDF